MNVKKLLVLLITFVIFVNYNNYFKKDTTKLYQQVLMLQGNIKTQKELSSQEINLAKKKEKELKNYFYDGKKYSYSQAMGAMQENITSSAKGVCQEPNIHWSQSPQKGAQLEKLRMDVSLRCDADMFNTFIANLKSKKKIYVLENLKISPNKRKNNLSISMQLAGYRINL